MEKFQEWLEKHHMEKWFRRDNLVILILAGILLIVIALPVKPGSEESNPPVVFPGMQTERFEEDDTYRENDRYDDQAEGNRETGIGSIGQELENAVDYTTLLESKLADILSRINGVGQVYVMITLQESEEIVVEKDLLAEREQTIYETEGNASIPYVSKTIFPKVEGVAVIAEGAGTGRVNQVIIEMIQALFDIELHKIKVAAG